MPVAVQQRLLHARPGAPGRPGQLDLPPGAEVTYGVSQPAPLLVHVKLGQIARSRDQAKNTQRRVDRQWSGWLGGLDIADDRFSLAQVLVGLWVEHGLPRQCRQLLRAQSQHHPQRLATARRLLHAGGVPAIDTLGEYRFEELSADFTYRQFLRLQPAAGRHGRHQYSGCQLPPSVQQLCHVQSQLARCGTGGCIHRNDVKAGGVASCDFQLKVTTHQPTAFYRSVCSAEDGKQIQGVSPSRLYHLSSPAASRCQVRVILELAAVPAAAINAPASALSVRPNSTTTS